MFMKRLPVAEEKSRVLERLVLEPGCVVVTAHRVESVDDLGRLSRIAHLVAGLAGALGSRSPRTRGRGSAKRRWACGRRSRAVLFSTFRFITFMHDRCPSARRSKTI
jgi:hypothetical protein